jgi:hypothetical protein
MTRDVNRAIEHVERVMARALDESSAKPPKNGLQPVWMTPD